MGTKRAFLAAVAVVAGCGGSGQPAEPSRYVLAPTRTCFETERGVPVETGNVDFVASTALGGALRVTLPATANFVIIAFGNDRAEGARLEQAYREFAGESIPIDSVLQRTKNVVLVWNGPPTPEEQETVLGCLRGRG